MESLLYEVPLCLLIFPVHENSLSTFFCEGFATDYIPRHCDDVGRPSRIWTLFCQGDPLQEPPGLATEDSLLVEPRQTHPTQTKPSCRGVERQNLYSQTFECWASGGDQGIILHLKTVYETLIPSYRSQSV